MNGYTKGYLDDCRSRIAEQVAAYKALAAASKAHATASPRRFEAVLEAFALHFFNSMVLALDGHLVHRSRAIEKKDGNSLNQVRMLSSSIMTNDSVMFADKTIKYDPVTAVLKFRVGDKVVLKESEFTRLGTPFFAEIEAEYL